LHFSFFLCIFKENKSEVPMNFKKIILGSAIAVASLGFTACGGDSGSDDPIGPTSSPGEKIEPVKQSALSPVVFSGIGITVMSGEKGMRGSLSGIIKLDPDFMDTSEPYTANVDVKIDSVKFAVGKVDGGDAYLEPVKINLDGVVFPNEQVFFSQKYLEFSDLSGCGTFKLFIYVYSSSKEEGIATTPYVSVHDSLTFTRPQSECEAPKPVESSSSAAAVCTPVTAVEDTLSNSMGTSKQALNFETGTADNPHITIKFAGSAATIVPSAGVTVYEDINQITGLTPTKSPICREDFSKATVAFTDEMTSGLWLDVVTADGKLFPMMVRKTMFESDTKGTVYMVYYR
jgi:hypothetical protein